MKYDFTSVINRAGWDAIAADNLGKSGAPGAPKDGFDPILMWIADMNFPTAPCVIEAINKRLSHPMFGYFSPRKEYIDAIVNWQKTHNGASDITADCIGYENGVLGGVSNALSVYCSRGDNVLLHSPTYNGFTSTLENCGYNIVLSPLVLDENGVWRMDFEDMERKIVENKIHATIFCSPHNPAGRVWERWELEKAMAIFEKHNVMIVSDEIWSDFVLEVHKHIPTQCVSEYSKNHTVAMYAPTKTFNIAGLIGSYHVIYNPALRDRIDKESSLCHYNSMNVLSMHALMGAYTAEGEEWLAELLTVLDKNAEYAYNYVTSKFEGVTCARPQGTYILYVDCTEWCEKHGKTIDDVLKAAWDVGVAIQDGRPFHGACHTRINLALPYSQLEEAFARLDKYVFNA